MRVLFTICGRAGSKGVKNKNIKDYLGTPLVFYTIAAIKLAAGKMAENGEFEYDVVINTDSKELAELATSQKSVDVKILWREAELGGDKVPKVAVIKDCYKRACEMNGCDYDVVVDSDITSPLRTVADIVNIINTKMSRPDVDAVYSVTGSRRNPYFNMVKEENGFFTKAVASNFTTRQEAPVFYDVNASLYAYAPRALREKPPVGFFNTNAYAIVMKDTAVLDIDSEEDFELIAVIGEYMFKKYSEFGMIKEEAEKL